MIKSLCRTSIDARLGAHWQCSHAAIHGAPGSVRHAGLSAIHRGVRRSEEAQSEPSRPPWRPTRGRAESGAQLDRTWKALEGSSSLRQQHKLQRKLSRKEIEKQKQDDNGRQTRRKRFLDPESSFGKRSLVYQLRHGSLRDTAASVGLQESVQPRPYASANPSESPGSSQNSRYPRRLSENQHHRAGEAEHNDRPQDMTARPRKHSMMPMTLTYTTAASQFLYGKSVVRSVLERQRRKIYRLYVHEGQNLKVSKENGAIIHLAKTQGIPITTVASDDQRLMDKMSMGRPHNGFVLETSPIPQLPVKSLGQTEERGFHVELDHQTTEQKAVNGESSFVVRPIHATRKPFVLFVHEIVDPGNLGALLRTASYFGVDAVCLTSRHTSSLSPVALKSAVGAAEEITLLTVESPEEFLQGSKSSGWKTYAAVEPPSGKILKMHENKFVSTEAVELLRPLDEHPCILVLGNEGYGLPGSIKRAADYELSVPKYMASSSVDSLNVSVAAGLLTHAFVKWAAEAEGTVRPSRELDNLSPVEASPEEEERLF